MTDSSPLPLWLKLEWVAALLSGVVSWWSGKLRKDLKCLHKQDLGRVFSWPSLCVQGKHITCFSPITFCFCSFVWISFDYKVFLEAGPWENGCSIFLPQTSSILHLSHCVVLIYSIFKLVWSSNLMGVRAACEKQTFQALQRLWFCHQGWTLNL